MKRHNLALRLLFVAPPFAALGCGSIPVDALPSGVELAPAGVIEGSVLYTGPRPCSRAGHIVGNVIIFAFDSNNLPPPNGTATTPVNFTVITGDAFFANEPRSSSSTLQCPVNEATEASGAYAMAPMNAGQYILQSFYDYTGDFFPTFKFANLPEMGDVGGGYVQLPLPSDGSPVFLPVTIGVPNTADASGTLYTMPSDGFVVSDVPITVGQLYTTPRPYFYPQAVAVAVVQTAGFPTVSLTPGDDSSQPATGPAAGSSEVNPNYVPVLTIPQDLQSAPPPNAGDLTSLGTETSPFEASLPHLRLNWGVATAEIPTATGVAPMPAGIKDPFHFQVAPYSATPSANASMLLQRMDASVAGFPGQLSAFSPQIALTKLIDDPTHTLDPESTTAQGSLTAPIVLIQAITLGDDGLGGDSLLNTADPSLLSILGAVPPADLYLDHVTGAILPVAVCFDPTDLAAGGTLVTPWGPDAGTASGQVIPADCFGDYPTCGLVSDLAKQGIIVTHVTAGCLPMGRYAVNAISLESQSAGQAWTTPNESGSCATAEGATNFTTGFCSSQARPIVYSQGNRAVVEVVGPTQDAGAVPNCTAGGLVPPTPAICLPKHQ